MLGIITLLIALGVQLAFLVWRMATKRWQKRAMHITRVASFATFSLLLLSGVYWWGFRWMGLFLLLAVMAALSVLYFIKQPKTEKKFKGYKAVFSCIGGCVLVTFCILPGILFPQFQEVASTGALAYDTQSVTLVDASRIDPFSETNESRKLTV